ncbi:MAG: uncharacterized protein JWO47_986 [Candidatus Saccharibacteria bacterium]|nr:uncharacterized protein [Candidatus Saccharibacteria bacterium]
MATYKVLQDIEAEDKLLGPLTLKQFIFAIITIGIGFIEFKLATTTALSVVRWPFVIVLLLPMIVFGFLAAPISRDQPNDIWLLARIRFLIKPHVRVWNQDGLSQLVTITVPKKLIKVFTNGLDQTEVESRLTALASTLDSRGWAIKNVDVNLFAQPGYLNTSDGTDRLVAPSTLISEPVTDVKAEDDIMDASNNLTAQHLDQMVQASAAQQQQLARQIVQGRAAPAAQATPPADYWFLNGQNGAAPDVPENLSTFQNTKVVAPGSADTAIVEATADEKALIAKIEAEKAKEKQGVNSHIKTLQPLSHQQPTPAAAPATPSPVTAPQAAQPAVDTSILPRVAYPPATPVQNAYQTGQPTGGTTSNPAILNLANNDDLNVATIARQAQRISEADDEVVISLH